MKVRHLATIGAIDYDAHLGIADDEVRRAAPGSEAEATWTAHAGTWRFRRWQARRGWLSRMGLVRGTALAPFGRMNGGAE